MLLDVCSWARFVSLAHVRSEIFFPPRRQIKDDGPKRMRGVASRWNDKGFCFIKPEDGSEEVFWYPFRFFLFSALFDRF
jgi:hypothetical protein